MVVGEYAVSTGLIVAVRRGDWRVLGTRVLSNLKDGGPDIYTSTGGPCPTQGGCRLGQPDRYRHSGATWAAKLTVPRQAHIGQSLTRRIFTLL